MAKSGVVVGKPKLPGSPAEPPWNDLENHRVYKYFHCLDLMGSTWIFMSVLHKLYENHRFHQYSNAKWTSEFSDFLTFR